MVSDTYDSRYLQGIDYFNECEFFEAHEIWEELWADDKTASREFYQGLIQVAVCLHHFGNGNTRGARKLFHTSSRHLESYRPFHQGLDVNRLLAQLEDCCRGILDSTEEYPSITIEVERIPEIHLESRGDA